MSTPGAPLPAMLVVSVLSARLDELWDSIEAGLIRNFGEIRYVSNELPFTATHYYDREMGAPILRRVAAFAELVEQERLVEIKQSANALEEEFRDAAGNRAVNLDPGLLTQERFVLATGKNHAHRIYLGRGVFADLTLLFKAGRWQALHWTFPDYASKPLVTHLARLRNIYRTMLEEAGWPKHLKRTLS